MSTWYPRSSNPVIWLTMNFSGGKELIRKATFMGPGGAASAAACAARVLRGARGLVTEAAYAFAESIPIGMHVSPLEFEWGTRPGKRLGQRRNTAQECQCAGCDGVHCSFSPHLRGERNSMSAGPPDRPFGRAP